MNHPFYNPTRNQKVYKRWKQLKEKQASNITMTLATEFKLSVARIYAIIKNIGEKHD